MTPVVVNQLNNNINFIDPNEEPNTHNDSNQPLHTYNLREYEILSAILSVRYFYNVSEMDQPALFKCVQPKQNIYNRKFSKCLFAPYMFMGKQPVLLCD